MPRYIVKLIDTTTNIPYYLEWSTVVDAPETYGMTLEEFKEYYKEEYGNTGMAALPTRLERVEKFGISAYGENLLAAIRRNHAGVEGNELSLQDIIKYYCVLKQNPE